MKIKVTSMLAGAAGILTLGLGLWAQPAPDDAVISFPDGYRKWVHVKSTLIGPQSPAFVRNGGIHHFYANDKALEGYRTGAFPDGSVLVDDLLEAKEAAGVTSDGPRRRVAVMVKGSLRYGESGGWGFEVFKGDGRDAALDTAAKAACFACHKNGRDSVFIEFRP
jgi:hypothetical protein